MKKLILAAVSASALLALSACGDAAEDEAADTTVVETETAPAATDTTAMDPAADPGQALREAELELRFLLRTIRN